MRVGADVGIDERFQREDPALLIGGQPQVLRLAPAVGRPGEGLPAVFDPPNGTAEHQREVGDHHVLRVSLALGSERPTDARDDHAHG